MTGDDWPRESPTADSWPGPGSIYRVEAQFGTQVTPEQLEADLKDASALLAAHRPSIVATTEGRVSLQIDVTATDIWLALLAAMVSVKRVFYEPLSVCVVTDAATETRIF